MIKLSCDLKGGASHSKSTSAKSSVVRHSSTGDTMGLVCHMNSQDHVIKGSCHFIMGAPHGKSTILLSLVTIEIVVVET